MCVSSLPFLPSCTDGLPHHSGIPTRTPTRSARSNARRISLLVGQSLKLPPLASVPSPRLPPRTVSSRKTLTKTASGSASGRRRLSARRGPRRRTSKRRRWRGGRSDLPRRRRNMRPRRQSVGRRFRTATGTAGATMTGRRIGRRSWRGRRGRKRRRRWRWLVRRGVRIRTGDRRRRMGWLERRSTGWTESISSREEKKLDLFLLLFLARSFSAALHPLRRVVLEL
jgi:hypothetical protein